MAILNPDHLLDQAEQLTLALAAGPRRQADLRRAVSTAYYAVFHFILTAAADEIVGITNRRTSQYVLIYRSVDHRALRELCEQVKKPQPIAKFAKYAPPNGFGSKIQTFASALVELQEKRHQADYDPSHMVKMDEARLAIANARSAIIRFKRASRQRRKAFLILLMFTPR